MYMYVYILCRSVWTLHSRKQMIIGRNLSPIETFIGKMRHWMLKNWERKSMVSSLLVDLVDLFWEAGVSLDLRLHFLHVDVEFYRLWLGRYRLQHIRAKDCPTTKDLGLMLVDTTELRNDLLPSPIRCLEVCAVKICNSLYLRMYMCTCMSHTHKHNNTHLYVQCTWHSSMYMYNASHLHVSLHNVYNVCPRQSTTLCRSRPR